MYTIISFYYACFLPPHQEGERYGVLQIEQRLKPLDKNTLLML